MASDQAFDTNSVGQRHGLPLPVEIRLMILRFALEPTSAMKIRPTKAGKEKKGKDLGMSPSYFSSMTVTQRLAKNNGYQNLQLTCKQFREDLTRPDFLYAGKTFQFRAPHRTLRYFQAIGAGRADQIQSLELDYNIFWFNTNSGACDRVFKRLRNCQKLKHLSLCIKEPSRISPFWYRDEGISGKTFLSWDEFRTNSFRSLTDLRGLETFKMPVHYSTLRRIWPLTFTGANMPVAMAQFRALSKGIEKAVTAKKVDVPLLLEDKEKTKGTRRKPVKDQITTQDTDNLGIEHGNGQANEYQKDEDNDKTQDVNDSEVKDIDQNAGEAQPDNKSL
ncbi:hypothetical protein BP5796_08465 [Coleophoma crateriformis]|uniref:Uncharacterized protein n=1 Tax=Coleophoma crateriformis TaxID=565419 RepID=A0A3D8R831_9HELO|nr:hypothetical protein BP5796_08465 [Coleophoma crateriformis]